MSNSYTMGLLKTYIILFILFIEQCSDLLQLSLLIYLTDFCSNVAASGFLWNWENYMSYFIWITHPMLQDPWLWPLTILSPLKVTKRMSLQTEGLDDCPSSWWVHLPPVQRRKWRKWRAGYTIARRLFSWLSPGADTVLLMTILFNWKVNVCRWSQN